MTLCTRNSAGYPLPATFVRVHTVTIHAITCVFRLRLSFVTTAATTRRQNRTAAVSRLIETRSLFPEGCITLYVCTCVYSLTYMRRSGRNRLYHVIFFPPATPSTRDLVNYHPNRMCVRAYTVSIHYTRRSSRDREKIRTFVVRSRFSTRLAIAVYYYVHHKNISYSENNIRSARRDAVRRQSKSKAIAGSRCI